ncbi:MAG: alpha-glucosidase [Oscillospiraceae bacterium]|nr:alpha-glucosidase [Oscillospiraceae bacterium]
MTRKWWHDKVAYQIYPKSFRDTNGDGIGDLRGIISKLDYLKDLGIDIVWISPIYRSPFVDQGYDISDYYDIDPSFGTMEEFDELLCEAKKRDIHIVMDLVINHCSDKHEWFQKALKDPFGEYGDYFYFRKGENGNPPSNTRSYFGGSTWKAVPGYDDLYYFHAYAVEQPDLNWENPEVLRKLYTMINWWLEKGVAGFRIDAIINIQKDLDFPSYPADGPDGLASVVKMVESVDGVGQKLQALKKNTFAKYDAFTVGEVFNMKKEELEAFVGKNGHFSTMFDFSANCLSDGPGGWYRNKPIAFADFRETIFRSQKECIDIGFLANIIENHDEPRGSSRFLPEYAQNEMGMKMLGTVSMLLRGLPFLYQGQEIGMTNCPMASVEEYNDINTINEYQLALEAGLSKEEALAACYRFSRDNARTPMQWDDSPNAGFTTGKPWLKVNPNYVRVNVAQQEVRKDSVLNYYKQLIALRKSEEFRELFTYGDFEPMLEDREMILAYRRSLDGRMVIVIANFGQSATEIGMTEGRVLLSNAEVVHKEDSLILAPSQVVVMAK